MAATDPQGQMRVPAHTQYHCCLLNMLQTMSDTIWQRPANHMLLWSVFPWRLTSTKSHDYSMHQSQVVSQSSDHTGWHTCGLHFSPSRGELSSLPRMLVLQESSTHTLQKRSAGLLQKCLCFDDGRDVGQQVCLQHSGWPETGRCPRRLVCVRGEYA